MMFHLPPSQVNFLTAWLVQFHQCLTECHRATHLLYCQYSTGLPCSMLHSKGVLPQMPAGYLARIKKTPKSLEDAIAFFT